MGWVNDITVRPAVYRYDHPRTPAGATRAHARGVTAQAVGCGDWVRRIHHGGIIFHQSVHCGYFGPAISSDLAVSSSFFFGLIMGKSRPNATPRLIPTARLSNATPSAVPTPIPTASQAPSTDCLGFCEELGAVFMR